MIQRSVQEVRVPRSSSSDSALYECKGTNIIRNKTQERKSEIMFEGKHELAGKWITNSIHLFTVIDPKEGPCAVNNGGCDHICTASGGTARCFCKSGYFSIVFLPSRCFGNF